MNCDWCGGSFAEGESPVAGYDNQPTHKACAPEARRSWRADWLKRSDRDPFEREEREPFNDWPNGQGTYD